ncbi:MAG: hypothetical protein PHH54_03165 [Candidatus Nanoarchaeia archaeon]|nr:hypothetical protein [Candidatus Nanoarchaeia archaeon]MDD5740960.1 hypothetical protein [Candidatus Nanoarchaeia archaeon]
MEIKYERKARSIFDYDVKLSEQEIKDLPHKPLEAILRLNHTEGCEKKFMLRVSSSEDDSNLEIHCHPSLTGWYDIKEIETTISPVAYDILNKNGKYESKHDHGSIIIQRV